MPLRRAGKSWWLPRNSGMPVASVDELVKETFGARCRAAACRPGHLRKRAQFRVPIVAAPIDCETGHIAALILDQVRTSMLSLCTSRCRWTNACEPRVQHFYTSRADPRHSKRGWTSPAPAVAHWRGCLRTIRGSLCRLAASSPARRRLSAARAGLSYASPAPSPRCFARRSVRPRPIISLIQPVEP
jgi:hypothetical protein